MRKLVALIMTIAMSASSAIAAPPTAVFHGNGQVTVNGADVHRSTAVFAGDRIRTADGAGTISAPGTAVLVHKASELVFGNDAIRILSGGATVKTSSAMKARVLDVDIRPATETSRFSVAYEGNKIYITSLEGSLAVGSKLTVPQGQMAVLAAMPAPASQNSSCVDGRKVDENGKFMLDNVGRYISCIDQTGTGGGATTIETGVSTRTVLLGFTAAGAAGGISAAIISQREKTDK